MGVLVNTVQNIHAMGPTSANIHAPQFKSLTSNLSSNIDFGSKTCPVASECRDVA